LRKYPKEVRERAIRLVWETRQQEPELSLTAAVKRIGRRVGVNVDTLRGWCKQGSLAVADVVLDNSGSLADLQRQVRDLWATLLARAR
jgi:transposase-like protein